MRTQRNELNFGGQNIYIGIDVHLRSWSVTIMSENISHKTFSQDPDPKILCDYLARNFPGASYYSAYEAGFSGYWIHNYLLQMGINSIVVNPADVPTTGKERDQKSDPRDSRKIARSLRAKELIPVYVPSLQTLEDRALIRVRAKLVKDITRNTNRIKSFLYFHGIHIPDDFSRKSPLSLRFIEWLKSIELLDQSGKQALMAIINTVISQRAILLQTNKQIHTLSRTEKYCEKVGLLRSIPGIGLLTAMVVLTEIETMERFSSNDTFCNFIGLVPSMHSSGEKDNKGDITSRGHAILRSAIVESAWVAVRLDPALMKCYNTYCKRMDGNKAIIRIAKKLANRIRYVLKNNKKYEKGIV